MSKIRQERAAEQIQVILSELFLHEVADPRLDGVTVTEVTIDRELKYANIYVNALGDDDREAEVIAGLESASGYLRGQIAQRIDLRTAPILRFHWDPRFRYVEEINELLDSLDISPASGADETKGDE
ncbi:MAG: 30S ribosome-binding factor RbfA [Candidatus Promineofilum sp.]|nr:30S ribosome-binding factor RbfA [Promineifilum sp.]